MYESIDENSVLDYVGIGFGPSNLAFAVAARELDASKKGLFFERRSSFKWHPGMMIDDARMQISFLKDLVTLRNPASPFTFLQYARARGRLEQFVNLRDFYPTRLEYQDYLSWVAAAFADEVHYATTVISVEPVKRYGETTPSLFRVDVMNMDTQSKASHYSRNVVYAAGGVPRLLEGIDTDMEEIVHSSEFLPRFPMRFPNAMEAYEFVVVGDGQSAGEIVAYLLHRYERAHVHFLISGCAVHATDSNPLINEQFFANSVDSFYHFTAERRTTLLGELRKTNYGVIDPMLIDDIYRIAYLDAVKGERRLFIHPSSKLLEVRKEEGYVCATIQDCFAGDTMTLHCDGLVLATGYSHAINTSMFAELLPYVKRTDAGPISLSRSYRVQTEIEMPCGMYVQGYGESSFGTGDTLLSMLPFRTQEIFEDICKRTSRSTLNNPPDHPRLTEYPPKQYLENDLEKLYAVIERFRFATLISVQAPDEAIITHVPLTLDRTRGAKGVLFGHMDRANPQAKLLDFRKVLVLFHGPDAFISPHACGTNQLPTWNSITVHVHGRVQLLSDRDSLVDGLCGIAEKSDTFPGAYRLDPDDPRIEKLLDFIVGFEIEIDSIIGRFKLSQDWNDSDRQRAAKVMARNTELDQHHFIEQIVGLSLTEDDHSSPRDSLYQCPKGEFND